MQYPRERPARGTVLAPSRENYGRKISGSNEHHVRRVMTTPHFTRREADGLLFAKRCRSLCEFFACGSGGRRAVLVQERFHVHFLHHDQRHCHRQMNASQQKSPPPIHGSKNTTPVRRAVWSRYRARKAIQGARSVLRSLQVFADLFLCAEFFPDCPSGAGFGERQRQSKTRTELGVRSLREVA